MQNSLLTKAPFRAEGLPRKTSENSPWCVSCGSTWSRHPLAAFHSEKKRKIAFFNNKTQSFSKCQENSSIILCISFFPWQPSLTTVIDSSTSISRLYVCNSRIKDSLSMLKDRSSLELSAERTSNERTTERISCRPG
jgi:hypothetical protein